MTPVAARQDDDIHALMTRMGAAARAAAGPLSRATTEQKNKALTVAALTVNAEQQTILRANALDLAEAKNLSDAMFDRLKLDPKRIDAIVKGLRDVAALPDPLGDNVVGAVVVEESTQAIVSFSNRAVVQLAAVTLIAFGVGALTLFFFASSLSTRLRKLRDEADNAIDSKGRVRGLVTAEHAHDEIGDLSRG